MDSIATAELTKSLRAASGLSQRAFAELVGTSGPTVAAYESGAKEPRLSTLERMAEHTSLSLRIVAEPRDPGTRLRARRARRRLALAAATADAVAADVERARRLAHENLARASNVVGNNQAQQWIERWRSALAEGPDTIRRILLAPGPDGEDMRQMQPFAGLLDESARRAALAAADAL